MADGGATDPTIGVTDDLLPHRRAEGYRRYEGVFR